MLRGRAINIQRPSDIAGVYGASLAFGYGARAIVLTNQKGAVLEFHRSPGRGDGECRFERAGDYDEIGTRSFMNNRSEVTGALRGDRLRVGKLFAKKHQEGFSTKGQFIDWWMQQYELQTGCCFYCETSIELIRRLIETHRLKGRKTGWGFRGLALELDRKCPNTPYGPDNCVLACYYCNNDKSNIYHWRDYKEFFGQNRRRHFKNLAKA